MLNGKRVDYFKGERRRVVSPRAWRWRLTRLEGWRRAEGEARRLKGGNGAQADRDCVRAGKTAIRTLLGPAYQKLKKVPPVKDEDEAKALMVKILPLYVVSSPSLAPPTTRLLTH